MSDFSIISKLGSTCSKIEVSNEIYKKSHILNNKKEYSAITKGIKCLLKENPETVHEPLEISNNFNNKDSTQLKFFYQQRKLIPWIEPSWITGEQLYRVGMTILSQQKILVENNLSFVDARPSNYWLAINHGKLVDLAGIKPISKQNVLSFESDFNNNFINPLILEKDLNIPISQFFKGNLESCTINLWGFLSTLRSFNRFKEASKSSIINYISNKISSSSPDFIEYLNSNHTIEQNIEVNRKAINKRLLNKIKLLNSLRPTKINKSNWDNYDSFHNEIYTQNKLKAITNFVNKYQNDFNIVDLGSNLTTKNLKGIYLRVDNDISVCRQMRQFFDDKKIILQLNIAHCLCFEDTNENKALNLFGEVKASIMTSIIHHLLIDYGLPLEIVFRNLANLYSRVLLEYPTKDDPMVKLLIRKKNEKIIWDWDKIHKPECLKYFKIDKRYNLSETRFMIELSKYTSYQ